MAIANLILIIVGIILIAVGILLVIIHQKKKSRCSCKLTATITSSRHFHNSVGEPSTNYGIYEYTYQGNTYYKTSIVGTTISPKIGKQVPIYVNPNNPEDCIVEGWTHNLIVGLFLGLGCLFLVVSIVLMIVF